MSEEERLLCQCCEYPATDMQEAIYRNDEGNKAEYLFVLCAVTRTYIG